MSIQKILQSKFFQGCLAGLAIFLVLLLVFKLGTIVGGHKADFTCGWGDNYRRNFGGKDNSLIPGLEDPNNFGGHGIMGEIIKIENNTIIINSPDNIEKIISVTNDTIIKRQRENINLSDIKDKDVITVIGSPNNQGQIEAKLIRVIPEPSFPWNLIPKPKFPKPNQPPNNLRENLDISSPASVSNS